MLQQAPGYTMQEIDCPQIKRCIEIGIIYMNPLRAERPTITKVIKMLRGQDDTDGDVSNDVMSSAFQVRSRKWCAYFPPK
jgi:hypothetical protein